MLYTRGEGARGPVSPCPAKGPAASITEVRGEGWGDGEKDMGLSTLSTEIRRHRKKQGFQMLVITG